MHTLSAIKAKQERETKGIKSQKSSAADGKRRTVSPWSSYMIKGYPLHGVHAWVSDKGLSFHTWVSDKGLSSPWSSYMGK